jgi:hypothetical protein
MFSTSNALETQVHKCIVWIFILTNWLFFFGLIESSDHLFCLIMILVLPF